MKSEHSRYDRGLDRMRAIFGPEIEAALQGLAATSPEVALHRSLPGTWQEGGRHWRPGEPGPEAVGHPGRAREYPGVEPGERVKPCST
jgi:hypothetical protein